MNRKRGDVLTSLFYFGTQRVQGPQNSAVKIAETYAVCYNVTEL